MIRFDFTFIREIEEKNNVKCVTTIRKENNKVYQRILAAGIKQIKFSVKTTTGTFIDALFITNQDYDRVNWQKPKKTKRHFKGRPYLFCIDCPHKRNCTLDTPCEKRDTDRKAKALRKTVQGDNRFYKNGQPKKCETLCQSGKYLYAHTGAKRGECQKEKCRFYEDGKCVINLDKKGNI